MDATCAMAGVDTMTYDLEDNFGTPVVMATDVACQDNIVFEGVNPGTYSLFVQGKKAGVIYWMATCNMLMGTSGSIEYYDCFVADDG